MKKATITFLFICVLSNLYAQNNSGDTTSKSISAKAIANNAVNGVKQKKDSVVQNLANTVNQKVQGGINVLLNGGNPFRHQQPASPTPNNAPNTPANTNINNTPSNIPTQPSSVQSPVANPTGVTNNPSNPVVTTAITQSFFGVNVTITGCVGSVSGQSVTLSLLISCPADKVNQYIRLGPPYGNWGNLPPAVDVQGNQLGLSSVQLGNNAGRVGAETEIFTGTNLKAMLIYNNVLPSSASISVLNLPIGIHNWAGKSNTYNGTLEFRNVAITWQ